MPIELTAREVDDQLALAGEHDLEAPGAIRAMLDTLSIPEDEEEADSPERVYLIRRYDLQIFLWYTLPLKFAEPPEDQLALCSTVASFFERLGERAADYAAVASMEETRQLIALWHQDRPRAAKLFDRLRRDSGLEAPDTPSLEWGDVMGFEEASVRDYACAQLEEAVEAGQLTPGARGVKRKQVDLVEAVLGEAPPPVESQRDRDLDGMTLLERIENERFERWRNAYGPRAALNQAVAELVRKPPVGGLGGLATAKPEDGPPLEPLRWLLSTARDQPLKLTQTGVCNRALVRAAVERFPGWWSTEVHGAPYQEAEIPPLETIRELALQRKLLRRRKLALHLTKRGEAAVDDLAMLAQEVEAALFTGRRFEDELGEAQLAFVLAQPPSFDTDAMHEVTYEVMVAEGWNRGGGAPLEPEDVHRGFQSPLPDLQHLGLLQRNYHFNRETHDSRTEVVVSEAGRELIRRALRRRALGPRSKP